MKYALIILVLLVAVTSMAATNILVRDGKALVYNNMFVMAFTNPVISWTDTNNPVYVWDMETTNGTATLDAISGEPMSNRPSVGPLGPEQVIVGTNQNGRVEHGYFLDGTDDYFTGGDLDGYTNAFTFLCWVKFTNLINNQEYQIWDKLYDAGTTRRSMSFYYDEQLNIRYTADLGFSGGSNSDKVSDGNIAPTEGIWYHVGITFTNSTLTFYQNGAQSLSTNVPNATTPLPENNAPLKLGIYWNITRPYSGYMDDARLYYGVLSQTAITNIFENTHPTNNIEARP